MPHRCPPTSDDHEFTICRRLSARDDLSSPRRARARTPANRAAAPGGGAPHLCWAPCMLPLRSCVTLNSLFLLAAVAFMASEEAGRQLKREMDQKREEARRIDYME